MKLPKVKKRKKMQGPMKFVKNTSKRTSPKKPFKSGSKKQITTRITESIVRNKKNTPKSKIRKPALISTLPPGQERLEKQLAQSGMASRREAKNLIKRRLVTVNGKVITEPGFGVSPSDVIKISGGVAQTKETFLFYKPRGIETSKTSPDTIDIHTKFPQFAHVNPVGRLDKDSEGLILLSNDGVLTRTVTSPQSSIEKEYRVTVREDVMPALLSKMENGIVLDGVRTKPCTAKKVSTHEFTITLTEGRKHQVRRMANACNLTVTKLVRIRIGDFTIGKMTAGNFKKIPNQVVESMKKGA